MIELTEEQLQAINGESPLRLLNPGTKEAYILVRADVYERMRAVIDGATRRAGWDDPKLDSYEQYRK